MKSQEEEIPIISIYKCDYRLLFIELGQLYKCHRIYEKHIKSGACKISEHTTQVILMEDSICI